MGDNLSRYYAVSSALRQLCPEEPKGNHARHLRTLAHLISGIVGSRRCHLGAVASKAPDGNRRESRVKRYTRWLQNERIEPEAYFLPYVRALLSSLPAGPLVLVIDASAVGRGCMALVVSVLYQKRALPLAWTVVRGVKGHLGEQVHEPLLNEVAALLRSLPGAQSRGAQPGGPEREVIILGDGEFDGTHLLTLFRSLGWTFVCRTGSNAVVWEDGQRFSLSWLNVEPGERMEFEQALFTRHRFGPVLVCAVWQAGEREPLYLVSSLELAEEAIYWYRKRFQIETFFSDQKSRGFHLAHCHVSDPMRLQRLLIATCLAYIWLVCLGAGVKRRGWTAIIHRKERCDLSLFQIGLHWIEHCLNEGHAVPVFFELLGQRADIKSVR